MSAKPCYRQLKIELTENWTVQALRISFRIVITQKERTGDQATPNPLLPGETKLAHFGSKIT